LTATSASLDHWRIVHVEGFMGLVGPLLRSNQPEHKNLYGLQTNEIHKNPIGIVHGGVITSLLDQVIAIEAWNAADRKPTVTVQMDTRFLGAAKAGDFLETQVKIRHSTRTLMFVDADVTCGDTLVATATAVMKISNSTGRTND